MATATKDDETQDLVIVSNDDDTNDALEFDFHIDDEEGSVEETDTTKAEPSLQEEGSGISEEAFIIEDQQEENQNTIQVVEDAHIDAPIVGNTESERSEAQEFAFVSQEEDTHKEDFVSPSGEEDSEPQDVSFDFGVESDLSQVGNQSGVEAQDEKETSGVELGDISTILQGTINQLETRSEEIQKLLSANEDKKNKLKEEEKALKAQIKANNEEESELRGEIERIASTKEQIAKLA